MNRMAISFAILAMLGATGATSGRAQTVIDGDTGDGAFFTIAVPDAWNGDLVVWNHGADLDMPEPMPSLGPLAPVQLAQGYAVAASSYRQPGWAVFKTKNDLQNLLDIFRAHFGTPDRIFMAGGSLGGIVTAAAIEEAHLGNLAGALSLCGAVAGSRNWDAALDLRLIYDAVCQEVPGADIPGGAEGLPDGVSLSRNGLALAVNACTGILLPPALRMPGQSERLQQILDTARIPEGFLIQDMRSAVFSMSDLVHDPRKLSGHIGTGNANVFYDDPFIDQNIARVSPHPGAQKRLARHYTPNGNVGDTKIVSMHTDQDGLVVVENESEYASVVPPGNLTTVIVVEAVPSHCGFTSAEAVAGWESLRGWVAGGPQPTASSIQLACRDLAPIFGGPCRIDPAFDLRDLDSRIRPRG